MSENQNAIVPRRQTFEVGDGKTTIVDLGGKAWDSGGLTEALEELARVMEKFMSSPTPAQETRQRSREDLKQKRRQSRRKGGRSPKRF